MAISKIRLSPEMAGLLRDVASKHGIDVHCLLTSDRLLSLTASDRDKVIDAISAEFAETGLGPKSEPNKRGVLLETLLDRVNDVLSR